jgi:hypothetical protein
MSSLLLKPLCGWNVRPLKGLLNKSVDYESASHPF